MNTELPTDSTATEPNLCRITLVGPASRQENTSRLRLRLHSERTWRRIVLELRIGSERCPDWYQANIFMTAIKDLIKMADGFLTDEVIAALQTHMDVVSLETYRP
jgi:hypothetical protein